MKTKKTVTMLLLVTTIICLGCLSNPAKASAENQPPVANAGAVCLGCLSNPAKASEENQPPVANAGADRVIYENDPAGCIVLNGSASYDPDGNNIITYSWQQIPAVPGEPRHNIVEVELIDPETPFPKFKIPQVIQSPDKRGIIFLAFELTVSDGELSSTDYVKVDVLSSAYNSNYAEELDDLLWQTDYDYFGRNYEFLLDKDMHSHGLESLHLWLNGINDDGTMWVEKELDVEAGKKRIDISFYIFQEESHANPLGYAVAYIGEQKPDAESDFECIGRLNMASGWTQFTYSKDVETAKRTRLWVAIGISCTWEGGLNFWLDEVEVNITNFNRPPVLYPIGNKKAQIGKALNFRVRAYDPDGNKLTMTVAPLYIPPNAVFKPLFAPAPAIPDITAYNFSWVPKVVGKYLVRFKVQEVSFSDEQHNVGLSDEEDVVINVLPSAIKPATAIK